MHSMMKISFGAIVLFASSVAIAQESEFQDKLQEDLDSYKQQIINRCGTSDKLTIKFNGKIGGNPRSTEDGAWASLSTMCTSALEGLVTACVDNKVVKKSVTKVTGVVCTKGTGTIGYSLKGASVTFTVDTKFQNSAAGQRDDLISKMKKDLDK